MLKTTPAVRQGNSHPPRAGPLRSPRGRLGCAGRNGGGMRLFRAIDYPPVWLAGFLAVELGGGAGLSAARPSGDRAGPGGGRACADAGSGGPDGAGAHDLRAAPVPGAMVSRGLFAINAKPDLPGRRPDSCRDVAFLERASTALPLVTVFVHVIRKRFIEGEETVLRQRFGPDFDAYCARVRRWI